MTTVSDALEVARQFARQISSCSPAPLPASEIIRLSERIAASEHVGDILTVLQQDALACLDQMPRDALGLARVAHELANAGENAAARADCALTLAIVLNRMGEFQMALRLCHSAAAEFETRGEKAQAARGYFEAAWAQTFLGHLNDSLAETERARQLDTSDVMNARYDWIQARVLRDQGSYPEAEKLFEKSRVVFESVDMHLDAARCTRELAHTYVRGDRAEARLLLDEIQQCFAMNNCHLDEALCNFFISLSILHKERYEESSLILSSVRERFVELGSLFYVAWCDLEIGIIHLLQNHFEESLAASHRAHEYFLTHAVIVEVSACDINIGLAYDALNRYDEALASYEEAADLSLKEGREVRAARIFSNMGLTYGKKGLYAKAMDFQHRALGILTDKGLDSLIGIALIRLAMACRQLGQYRQAIEQLQRAKVIFQKNNLAIELGECEFDLADVYFALFDSSNAQMHLRRAHEIYNENKLESMVAVCDRLLAQIANDKSDRAHSLSLLTKSRAAFTQNHQIVDAALCDLIEGELYVEWGEKERARQALLRAQSVLSPAFPDQGWRVESGLGSCARMADEPKLAVEHYLKAVHTIEQSRSSLVTEQLSNGFFSARQSVYDNALKIAMELDKPESALEVVEASKARVFLSILQNREWHVANDRNDPDIAKLVTREKELRYQLDALRTHVMVKPPEGQNDALRGDTQAQISTAELQELGALSQAYESVVTRLRLYSSGLTGVSSPASFALAEFREKTTARLGNDWTALDYYLSGDDLTCIVIQPTRVSASSRRLSAYERSILDNHVSQEHDMREIVYNGTLQGKPVPSSNASDLDLLYHLLMPERLDSETLIIAPHGVLHALPFHALKRGDDFLIQHHTLVYTPSLQALQFLLGEEPIDSFQSLAVGLSDFENHMCALPFTRIEIERLQAVFGERAKIMWGEQATRKELFALDVSGALQKYNFLHFATHAILDPDAPHRSRVLLDDEALTVLDIMDLELNARLVTLSACETALGQGGRGDELVGLARAFFYAGARALVASLWSVADRSVAELIGYFYRHLADGENNAVALRHAQVEMIQAGYSPFHWASLALMGRP